MGNVKIKMGGHWRKITEEGLEELISRYESQLANTKRGLVRKTEMLEHLISRRPKQLEIKEQPSAHGKPTMVGMEEAGMKKINRDKFWWSESSQKRIRITNIIYVGTLIFCASLGVAVLVFAALIYPNL